MAQKNRYAYSGVADARLRTDVDREFRRLDVVLNDKVAYLDASTWTFAGPIILAGGQLSIDPGPLVVGPDPGGTARVRIGHLGGVGLKTDGSLDTTNLIVRGPSSGPTPNIIFTDTLAIEADWFVQLSNLGDDTLSFEGRPPAGAFARVLGLKSDGTVTAPIGPLVVSGEVRIDHASNAHLEFYIGGVRKAGLSVTAADIVRLTDSGGTVKLQVNLAGTALKIIPPSTSLAFRNNADNADNVLIADAGDVTVRRDLVVNGTNVTLGVNAGASANLALNAAAATLRQILFQSAGVNRWIIRTDTTAETGSDTGAPFLILARDDSGALIDAPITIIRAAGGAITANRQVVFTVDVGTRYNNHTNGAAAAAGTLLNAPAAGNPAFWLPVSIAGTTRHIPCW